MKVLTSAKGFAKSKGTVVTLGNFDGVHLGHLKILKKVSARAKTLGLKSVVYTFEPHPQKIVAPHKGPLLISDLDDKKKFIKDAGIDVLVLAKFTKAFSNKNPEDFVRHVIVNCLNAKEVYIGYDYSFGRGKSGTVEKLKTLSKEHGFKLTVVAAVKKNGYVVSSSLIRQEILSGRVDKATEFLGRAYTIKGKVVSGTNRGSSIGFPTANIDPVSEIVPATGVYAAYAVTGGKPYKAAVNIGTSPTFGAKIVTVEAHLINFKGSLYGRNINLIFVKRLRDEKKFPSVNKLVSQIKKDVARAKAILS